MKKIYLFRHGETDWNKENRLQYSKDIPLNKTGIEQAERNAEYLRDKGIQYIYSSPLKRAYKTAEILANKINVKIEVVENLKEANAGEIEGLHKNQREEILGKEFIENFFNNKDTGMDLRFPGGESKKEIRNRITKTIEEICKNTPYNIIAISSHSCVLREFLRNYTKIEGKIKLKNCEIIEAEFNNNNNFKINWNIKNE